nr:glycosyltransferase family 4 protein [uncultured Flavobacterium sp.]
MRVLWITNIPFGPLCELIGESISSSGSWLNASFDALSMENEIELTIVTVSRIKELRKKKEGNHSFYILPGGHSNEYDYNLVSNKKNWEQIKNECKPDLIHIWGTEYTHGYLALKVMEGIPAVIYMQGLMSQIANHYLSGMSDNDLYQSITLRDILKRDWIKRQQANFKRRAVFESKMLKLAGNVIVENEWCKSHCLAIAPNISVFKSKLNIKKEFYNDEWTLNKMQPLTIMSNASGYPIKGLHILLMALNIVVKKYPHTKLFIPGEKSPFEKSFIDKCKITGYTKYIMNIVEKYNLKENIVFLDKLSATQMATQMANSNVFVMPSSIENHSSTLIEAMIVGVPCISSYVGGISEYMLHNENGLIYRFEEYEILAAHIERIFEDDLFAVKIATSAKNTMRNSRDSISLKGELLGIYNKILNSN